MTEFILAGWFGTWEIVIIFAALLLLFGGRKIPELMKGIGKGIREFNDAKDKVKANIEEGMKTTGSEDKSEDEDKKDN